MIEFEASYVFIIPSKEENHVVSVKSVFQSIMKAEILLLFTMSRVIFMIVL